MELVKPQTWLEVWNIRKIFQKQKLAIIIKNGKCQNILMGKIEDNLDKNRKACPDALGML